MKEDIFKDVPEEIIEDLKVKYEHYKATVKEPKLTLVEYISESLEAEILTKEIVTLEEEKAKIEVNIKSLEKKIEENNKKLAEAEAEKLIANFNGFYETIANDTDLTSEEKLKQLKAYYFTSVRNMFKEVKFLNNLHELIKQQEQEEEGIDVILIDFEDYVKQFYK